MKKLFICSFFVLLVTHIQAQEEITLTMPRLRLGIEAGVSSVLSQINKPEMIRENRYHYYDQDYDYYCGFVRDASNVTLFNFGAKLEYVLHKRIAVASGLRFSFYKATLNSDRDCFLWKVSETEISSNYIKINNISQTNYYLGIPLEIRFFLSEKDYAVRTYFIVGTSFNFLAASENKIAFHNPEMEKYSSGVLEYIGNPSSFYCSLYGGFGLKFGKANYPFGNLEFFFPMLNFEKYNTNAFTEFDLLGFGIRTTLNIPVARKHKLTYTVTD